MKITNLPHDCDKFFLNGDFISMDNYVIINDRKEIFRNGELFEIKGNCSYDFPKVKIISSEQFLLVDADREDGKCNAWIINSDGYIEKSFFLGGVHRMIILTDYIICSYTDSQLDTNAQYGKHGLVVFDYNGESKFEYYRDEDRNKWIEFLMENYAFLEKDENTIYYMPYSKLPIVEFSLLDFSSKVIFQMPDYYEQKNHAFWNPTAFSKKGNDWFFITPDIENDNSCIFKIGSQKRLEQIGTCCFSHSPQGLKNGSFFVPFSGGMGKPKKCQLIEI